MTDLEAIARSTANLLNTVAKKSLAPFARPDLFIGEQYRGHGNPPTFLLVLGLTTAQRNEAMALVDERYPSIAYGGYLVDNEIHLHSAD